MLPQAVMQLALVPCWCFLLAVAQVAPTDSHDNSCSANAPCAATGAQLLQLKRSETPSKASLPAESQVVCSSQIGKSVPLTSDGFLDVAESCCYDDMKDFIRRAARHSGLQVCDEGGLSGFAPFFSCANTTSFALLQNEMEAALTGKCKWLAHTEENCTAPDPSCGVSLNPFSRQSLLKGYLGIEAENNPPALVTNMQVKDRMTHLLASTFGLPEEAMNVAVGTGPVGEGTYQASLKSRITGKFVEEWPNGDLVASAGIMKNFEVVYDSANGVFALEGIAAKDKGLTTRDGPPVAFKWAESKEEGFFYFQNAATGEYLVEDENGHVLLSGSTGGRLEIQFHGFSLLATSMEVPTIVPANKSKHTHRTPSFFIYNNTGLPPHVPTAPQGTAQLLEGKALALANLRRSCTVLVSYEVVQTEPPTLNEVEVQKAVKTVEPERVQEAVAKEIGDIDPCLGALGISTFKYCQDKGTCDDKSLKAAHSDKDYKHVSHPKNLDLTPQEYLEQSSPVNKN